MDIGAFPNGVKKELQRLVCFLAPDTKNAQGQRVGEVEQVRNITQLTAMLEQQGLQPIQLPQIPIEPTAEPGTEANAEKTDMTNIKY